MSQFWWAKFSWQFESWNLAIGCVRAGRRSGHGEERSEERGDSPSLESGRNDTDGFAVNQYEMSRATAATVAVKCHNIPLLSPPSSNHRLPLANIPLWLFAALTLLAKATAVNSSCVRSVRYLFYFLFYIHVLDMYVSVGKRCFSPPFLHVSCYFFTTALNFCFMRKYCTSFLIAFTLKNTQIVPDTCVHCVSMRVLGNNFIFISESEQRKKLLCWKIISVHKNTENTEVNFILYL